MREKQEACVPFVSPVFCARPGRILARDRRGYAAVHPEPFLSSLKGRETGHFIRALQDSIEVNLPRLHPHTHTVPFLAFKCIHTGSAL